MNKFFTALALALALAAATPAYADWHGGHGGGWHGGGGGWHGGGWHGGGGGWHGGGFGPGIALGLGLGALGGALLYPPYYAPPPVYYAPPPVYYAPPPQAYYPPCPPAPPGYYCASDGRLYPYPR